MAAGIDVTTVALVKQYAKKASSWTDHDDQLGAFIKTVSTIFENHLNRVLKSGTVTEELDVFPDRRRFYLKAYPVTSVTTVWSSAAYVFDATTEVDSGNYHLVDSRMALMDDLGYVERGLRTVRITYVGGMAATQAAFTTAFPDITEAANIQVWNMFQRIGEEDAVSINLGGQSIALKPALGLLPIVKKMLAPYRNTAA